MNRATERQVSGAPRISGRRESAFGREFLVRWPSSTAPTWMPLDVEKWSREVEEYEKRLEAARAAARAAAAAAESPPGSSPAPPGASATAPPVARPRSPAQPSAPGPAETERLSRESERLTDEQFLLKQFAGRPADQDVLARERRLRDRACAKPSRVPVLEKPIHKVRRGHAHPADNGWEHQVASVMRQTTCDRATAMKTLKVAGGATKAVSSIRMQRQMWGHEKERKAAGAADSQGSTEEQQLAAQYGSLW